jgi:ankyrin repeat protein
MASSSTLSELLKLMKVGDVESVRQFPPLSAAVTATDHNGSTALHVAAWQGRDSIAMDLITAGSNLDALDYM